MTIIKSTTKKGMAMLKSAQNNEGTRIWQVYENPSYAKECAFQWCKELCYNEKGTNFHIISHNTFHFSCAWETAEGVRIETRNHSYFIPYSR